MVNKLGAWLVTAGWSVGRVLQPLLSPPLPGTEQNLVSGQPLGPWHQEKRAGSAAAGAFVFTSPQLASCQTCVIPGRSRGPCRDPPPHAQHRTPLFFSSLGTAEQVKPTQTVGPHTPGGNNHLVPHVGARGLWTLERAIHPPGPPAPWALTLSCWCSACIQSPEPSTASPSAHGSSCHPWAVSPGPPFPHCSPQLSFHSPDSVLVSWNNRPPPPSPSSFPDMPSPLRCPHPGGPLPP